MRRTFDILPLEGRTSLPVAADYLHDVTRQRVYQMGVDEGVFTTIRSIAGAGTRPAAYVIENGELLRVRRLECGECRDLAAASGGKPADLLFCQHTDLVVPPEQEAALRETAKQELAVTAGA